MSLISDLRVLYHLALRPIRGKTHEERLDQFYSGQTRDYDAFRARLLRGREELLRTVELPTGVGTLWADIGAGTGVNLEPVAERVPQVEKIVLVDLSRSMLDVAKARVEQHGWSNVEVRHGDATTAVLPDGSADFVTFFYSLTMIPGWYKAVERAYDALKPGGLIGVVDFYVSMKHPEPGRVRHSFLTRSFWPVWFSMDNVYLKEDHAPYLHHRFECVHFEEHRAPVPYMLGARVPYYLFIGRKPKI